MDLPIAYGDCGICAVLWEAFTSDNRWFKRELPCLKDILDGYCAGHSPFFHYVKSETPECPECADLQLEIYKDWANGSLIFTRREPASHENNHPPPFRFVAVPKRGDEGRLSFPGRILDPDWIDVNLIKEWTRKCLTLHGNKCSNPARIPRISPNWLIDTLNACIVPGQEIVDYVALSYRWGASKGFKMDTENLKFEAIRQTGALRKAHVVDNLPPSIMDAIKLVESIGERYLWVDAVCIDQRDGVHFGRQLEMMGAIYASAKLTIVAAEGDATSGIKGLKGISSSRGLEQVVLPMFENYKVVRVTNTRFYNTSQYPDLYRYFGIEGDDKYFGRGWTHQEFNLSKRCIIFYNKRIFFRCTEARWCEDIILETMPVPRVKYFIGHTSYSTLFLDGIPDLRTLSLVLEDYNSRNHSYAEDALPGAIGYLSIIGRSFKPGFLCGLPEACFDAALLWCTNRDSSQTRRRVNSGQRRSNLLSPLPSWSWIGWQTPSLNMAAGENLYVGWVAACRTTPITQWYTHEFPSTGFKRPIQSTWFSLRESFNSSSSALPPGWAKRKSRQYMDDILSPRVASLLGVDIEYVYYHTRDPSEEFWLPFHIDSVDEERVPWSPPQTPFISCKTKRGWFTARRMDSTHLPPRWAESWRLENRRLLLTSEGLDNCGTLEPHTGIDTLLGITRDRTLEIELVAICAQMRKEEFTFGNHEWYEVYGVLWIEWVDGIAYRQGSGVVYKEAWESHLLEDVDLILG